MTTLGHRRYVPHPNIGSAVRRGIKRVGRSLHWQDDTLIVLGATMLFIAAAGATVFLLLINGLSDR